MISSGGPVRVWKYINRGGRNWLGRRGGADASDNVRTARATSEECGGREQEELRNR